MFDPRGGYWQPGGKFMPSIVAEIGYVVETPPADDRPDAEAGHGRLAAAAGRVEAQGVGAAQQAAGRVRASRSYPEGAQLCVKCNTAAVVDDGRLHDLPVLRRFEVRVTTGNFSHAPARVPARRLLTTGAARDLPGGLRAAFFRRRTTKEGSDPFMRNLVAAALMRGLCHRARLRRTAASGCRRVIVRADPVVSAGSPIQIRIRQVDGHDVGFSASKVELPPGKHAAGRGLPHRRDRLGAPVHAGGGAGRGRALPGRRRHDGAKL